MSQPHGVKFSSGGVRVMLGNPAILLTSLRAPLLAQNSNVCATEGSILLVCMLAGWMRFTARAHWWACTQSLAEAGEVRAAVSFPDWSLRMAWTAAGRVTAAVSSLPGSSGHQAWRGKVLYYMLWDTCLAQ